MDIIARCQHGLLVPPTQISRIADACHHLLTDKVAWQRHSEDGQRNVSFYTWSRHASQYLRDTARLRLVKPPVPGRPVTRLLATDMDGTLLGHRDGLLRLEAGLNVTGSVCLWSRPAGLWKMPCESWKPGQPRGRMCS